MIGINLGVSMLRQLSLPSISISGLNDNPTYGDSAYHDEELTAVANNFPDGVTFSYVWRTEESATTLATTAAYTPTSALNGDSVYCIVTPSDRDPITTTAYVVRYNGPPIITVTPGETALSAGTVAGTTVATVTWSNTGDTPTLGGSNPEIYTLTSTGAGTADLDLAADAVLGDYNTSVDVGNNWSEYVYGDIHDLSVTSAAAGINSIVGTATGETTAQLDIDAEPVGATVYWYISTSATPPSATDLKAGTGAADSNSYTIASTPQALPGPSGLTASTGYYAHALARYETGVESAIVTSALFTTEAADVTAPILSSATATVLDTTTARCEVTTDEDNGVITFYVSNNATPPSAGDLQAGTGAVEYRAVTVNPSESTISVEIDGLSEAAHYLHIIQVDDAGNVSTIASTGAFTPSDVTAPVLSSLDIELSGTLDFSGTVNTDTDEGELDVVITASSTTPTATQIKAGQDHTGAAAGAHVQDQAVSATGPQAFSGTGLMGSTQYWAHATHTDAAGNEATPETSIDTFTTGAATAAPDAFVLGDWSLADATTGGQLDVTIASLPANNGAAITDIEYTTDSGTTWTSSVGVVDFSITGLTNDVSASVEIRAVNSGGAGATSDTKSATPTLAVDPSIPIQSIYGQSLAVGTDPNYGAPQTAEASKTITGATKTSPVVITAVGHGYSEGDQVLIRSVGGMTQVNNSSYQVRNPTTDTFELYRNDGLTPSVLPLNGTAYGTYTSGGTAHRFLPFDTHFMANGGYLTQGSDPDNTNVDAAFYPDMFTSIETYQHWTVSSASESMAVGMAGVRATPTMFTSSARGAMTITALSRGTIHYANFIRGIQASRLLLEAGGDTVSMRPIVWKQGEADAGVSKTRTAYKTELETLLSDMQRSLRTALEDPTYTAQIMTDQLAMHLIASTTAEIAVGVLELHRSNPNIFVAGPGYWNAYTAINDVHMTALGYIHAGELFEHALDTLEDTGDWNPTHINSQPTRSGTTITVPIYVPEGALVKDTTLVASVANDGFTYTGAGITSVTIVDDGSTDNQAVVEVELDAAAAGTLRFAYNNGNDARIGPTIGMRGNLRDSSTLLSTHDGANLYNWLCTDQWSVS